MTHGKREGDGRPAPARTRRGPAVEPPAPSRASTLLAQVSILVVLATAAVLFIAAATYLTGRYGRPIGIGMLGGLALVAALLGLKFLVQTFIMSGLGKPMSPGCLLLLAVPLVAAAVAGISAALRALEPLGPGGWLWVALGAGVIVVIVMPALAILAAVTKGARERVARFVRGRRGPRPPLDPSE